MLPHKHYNEKSAFRWDPFQQSLGMLQIEFTSQALKSIHNGATLVVKTWCIGGIIYRLGIFQKDKNSNF